MTRTAPEMKDYVERWYQLWNEQDKDGWLAHWQSFAPGEPSLEDPVGSPVKRGWGFASELWDRTGPNHPKVFIEQLIVGGDEVVVVCRNEGRWRGEPVLIPSIDLHQLHSDGSSSVRSFWVIPDDIPYGKWTATTGGTR